MYRCDRCKNIVEAGLPANMVVTKIRPRTYRVTRAVKGPRKGRPTYQEVQAGTGWEPVEELSVCAECRDILEKDESIPERIGSLDP